MFSPTLTASWCSALPVIGALLLMLLLRDTPAHLEQSAARK
jgi:hypothetical protein